MSRAIPHAGNSQQLLICKICNETFPAVYPVYIVKKAGQTVYQWKLCILKETSIEYCLLPDIL